jgi:hypothetical protein
MGSSTPKRKRLHREKAVKKAKKPLPPAEEEEAEEMAVEQAEEDVAVVPEEDEEAVPEDAAPEDPDGTEAADWAPDVPASDDAGQEEAEEEAPKRTRKVTFKPTNAHAASFPDAKLVPAKASPETDPSKVLKSLLPAHTGQFDLPVREGGSRVYFLFNDAEGLRYRYTNATTCIPADSNHADLNLTDFLSTSEKAPQIGTPLLQALAASHQGPRPKRPPMPPLVVADLVVEDGKAVIPEELRLHWTSIMLKVASVSNKGVHTAKEKAFPIDMHAIFSEGDWTAEIPLVEKNLPFVAKSVFYKMKGNRAYHLSPSIASYRSKGGRVVVGWFVKSTPSATNDLDDESEPVSLENATHVSFSRELDPLTDDEGSSEEPRPAEAQPQESPDESDPAEEYAAQMEAEEEQEEEEAAAPQRSPPTVGAELDRLLATTEPDAPASGPAAPPATVIVQDPVPVTMEVEAPSLRAVDSVSALRAKAVEMLPPVATKTNWPTVHLTFPASEDPTAMATRHSAVAEAAITRRKPPGPLTHEVLDVAGHGTVLLDSAQWSAPIPQNPNYMCYMMAISFLRDGVHHVAIFSNYMMRPEKSSELFSALAPATFDHKAPPVGNTVPVLDAFLGDVFEPKAAA